MAKPVTTLCCYYADPGFVAATAAIVRRSYAEARASVDPGTHLRIEQKRPHRLGTVWSTEVEQHDGDLRPGAHNLLT
jgi:hypothetical protein